MLGFLFTDLMNDTRNLLNTVLVPAIPQGKWIEKVPVPSNRKGLTISLFSRVSWCIIPLRNVL